VQRRKRTRLQIAAYPHSDRDNICGGTELVAAVNRVRVGTVDRLGEGDGVHGKRKRRFARAVQPQERLCPAEGVDEKEEKRQRKGGEAEAKKRRGSEGGESSDGEEEKTREKEVGSRGKGRRASRRRLWCA
jgi:hypothetical protein